MTSKFTQRGQFRGLPAKSRQLNVVQLSIPQLGSMDRICLICFTIPPPETQPSRKISPQVTSPVQSHWIPHSPMSYKPSVQRTCCPRSNKSLMTCPISTGHVRHGEFNSSLIASIAVQVCVTQKTELYDNFNPGQRHAPKR